MTANKNRAILEPQAIFNEIPASGFSFCSLLFLGIKKPQSLNFSKDCGTYYTNNIQYEKHHSLY